MKKVRIYENLNGMKQTELAEKVGSANGDIYKYATGKVYPGVIKALKIARALGVSVEDIWGECVEEGK